MAPGAGLVKNGENGKGISSRWYPETLARRIREIEQVQDRFSFIEGDGLSIIEAYADDESAAFFADPPYTFAARRLYSRWEIDHRRLFALLSDVKGKVLLTYDDADEARVLAREFHFDVEEITMKNTHHAHKKELLISRNLTWLRNAQVSAGSRFRIPQASQGRLL
jgi:DNA adenine methylase